MVAPRKIDHGFVVKKRQSAGSVLDLLWLTVPFSTLPLGSDNRILQQPFNLGIPGKTLAQE